VFSVALCVGLAVFISGVVLPLWDPAWCRRSERSVSPMYWMAVVAAVMVGAAPLVVPDVGQVRAPTDFSVDRALAHIARVAEQPHPMGAQRTRTYATTSLTSSVSTVGRFNVVRYPTSWSLVMVVATAAALLAAIRRRRIWPGTMRDATIGVVAALSAAIMAAMAWTPFAGWRNTMGVSESYGALLGIVALTAIVIVVPFRFGKSIGLAEPGPSGADRRSDDDRVDSGDRHVLPIRRQNGHRRPPRAGEPGQNSGSGGSGKTRGALMDRLAFVL
jgi:hypothetical protein